MVKFYRFDIFYESEMEPNPIGGVLEVRLFFFVRARAVRTKPGRWEKKKLRIWERRAGRQSGKRKRITKQRRQHGSGLTKCRAGVFARRPMSATAWKRAIGRGDDSGDGERQTCVNCV